MPNRYRHMVLALASSLLFLAGCAGSQMTYVEGGNAYETSEIAGIAGDVPRPDFEGSSVADVEGLRHEQLVALRSEGLEASRLASVLTAAFPADSRSVPFYAEEATLDQRPVWIVIELWGPAGGNLEIARTWVLDRESGEVLLSISGM